MPDIVVSAQILAAINGPWVSSGLLTQFSICDDIKINGSEERYQMLSE